MTRKIISKNFFTRPTLQVAHDLLGKFLVRKIGNKEISVMITEVEAYDGPRDRASHASRGMTERNAIMFGSGGYFYVYLCYGMYEMLNIVTGEKGYPAAILLRGAEINNSPLERPAFAKASARQRVASRGTALPSEAPPRSEVGGVLRSVILNGPGKLTKFLKIDRRFNKKSADKKTGLWFEDRGVKINEKMIKRTPRIGVAYAGPVWSKKPHRFLIDKLA